MKTITYTDSRHLAGSDMVFIRPVKPATPLRRFQLYIETSDWDEQVIRSKRLFDSICLTAVILSALALFPFIVAAVLK